MEVVSIKIPASPEYLQIVRLMTSGLAARLGFTLDDIEDLKIGVDEVSAYLIGPQGRDGSLTISFTVGDDRIEIEGTGDFTSHDGIRTELTEFSRMILATLVDSAALRDMDSSPCFKVTKARRS